MKFSFNTIATLKTIIRILLMIVAMFVAALIFESNHYGIGASKAMSYTSASVPAIVDTSEVSEYHVTITLDTPTPKPTESVLCVYIPKIPEEEVVPSIPVETIIPSMTINDTELLPEEIIPVSEHPIYYVIHDGYRFDMPVEWQNYLWELLKEYGIEEHYALCIALIYHESKFNANAISVTNDYGLMQINICNHNYLKNQLGIINFLDPYDNMKAGIFTLSQFLKKYDAQKALVCYNMGETRGKNYTESAYSRAVISCLNYLYEIHEE